MCRVVELALHMPRMPGARRVAGQLVGAAAGIGSNLEKARGASSRRQFVRFNAVSLRRSRETAYWLTICERTGLGRPRACRDLLDEAQQIALIIGRLAIATRKNGTA